MDKERILAILRAHEPELKAAGLLHLRLFGSMARGDNTPASDIDLLFDCEESQTFRAYGFEERMTQMLSVKAHLSSAKSIKPKMRDRVLPEAIDVF